jgi:integrase
VFHDEPARRDVRLHDLRHTFAVLQLSAGTHFMQVSKWLGHSTFTLTLDVYGDYIPEQDGSAANNLPEPPAPAKHAKAAVGNVVQLRRPG